MSKFKVPCSNNVKTEWTMLDVEDGTKMDIFIAKPMETTKAPALLVFHEAFGITPHIRDVAQRFAKEGFFSIVPALFHRTAAYDMEIPYHQHELTQKHTQAIEQETLSADLKAVANFCHNHPQVNADWLGAIGYCMGGRVAYIANATLPLKAAISYYGGQIAQNHLSLAAMQHGPLLLVWAGMDPHVTLEHRILIKEALYNAKKNFVDVEFSHAVHGFFCDDRGAYHPIVAKQAWALTLAFLKTYLPSTTFGQFP